MFCTKEKGFSLIELLIVIAIISILSAVAIPQFIKYKKNAAEAYAVSTLTNCFTELAADYAVEDKNEDTCRAGNKDIEISLDESGNFIMEETTFEVKNISVTCKVVNANSFNCTAKKD